jgi:thymidylate synthase (FAD)
MQQRVAHNCKKEYDEAIRMGIAKELARKLLPEGLTKTRLYMNGTLRSWVHYIELRASNGTQKEHMDVARECAKAIAAIFPMAAEFVPA